MNLFGKNFNLKITSAFLDDFDDQFYMGPHIHPRYEIMYCKTGEFSIEIYSDKKSRVPIQTIVIKSNSYIILHPQTIHRLLINQNGHASIINLEYRFNNALSDDSILTRSVLNVNCDQLFLIEKNAKNFFNNQDGYVVAVDNGMFKTSLTNLINVSNSLLNDEIIILQQYLLFCQLVTDFSLSFREISSSSSGVSYVNSASKYIKQNYTQKISANDVAQHVGISKYYLQKLFRSFLDTSILSFTNDFRIKKAITLLETTQQSITQIYQTIGFENRQAFSYEFKKKIGTTPQKYRALHEKNAFKIPISTIEEKQTQEIFSDIKS